MEYYTYIYFLGSRIELKTLIMLQDFSHALLKRSCLACGLISRDIL